MRPGLPALQSLPIATTDLKQRFSIVESENQLEPYQVILD
jgi:hypothetical protein